jgi:hypothetical protein
METIYETSLERALEKMDELGQFYIVTLDRLSQWLYAIKIQHVDEVK